MSLFTDPKFLTMRGNAHVFEHGSAWIAFHFERWEAPQVYYMDGWLNGKRSPYGGFRRGATLEDMQACIAKIPEGAVRIALAPSGHDEQHFALQVNALMRAGFKVVAKELNFERTVDGAFQSELSRGNQRCLEACDMASYRVDGGFAYDVLKDSRERKGRKMGMSEADMLAMMSAFPNETWTGRVVDKGGRPIAAAFCVQCEPEVLYVSSWGAVADAQHSPTVMLAKAIYDRCRTQDITLMDIGIATESGEPNAGLCAFKRSLGFRESLKLTLERA